MNTEPIVVEQAYDVPGSTVWRAITDKDQMRQWYFETMTEFKPEPGFESSFIVQCEGVDYSHLWTVTIVVPETKIAYRWRYEGYPGDSTVTWDLSDTPRGTLLKLTHSGIETFPQDDPIFSRESGVAGWDCSGKRR